MSLKDAERISKARQIKRNKLKLKIKREIIAVLLLFIAVTPFCITVGLVGQSDYESGCNPHRVVAINNGQIKTERGNVYDVPFSVEEGQKYIVLFDVDNVTPMKIVSEVKDLGVN